jgi:small-conductance mechanosensitive channel
MLLLFSTPVPAGMAIPGLGAAQTLEENKAAAGSPAAPPDPGALSADWWRYFDTEPGILKGRIEQVTARLKNIQTKLAADGKADAKVSVDNLKAKLLVYLEMRNKTDPGAPAAKPFQNTYTVEQWLDTVHKLRTLQSELQSGNEDILFDEKRFKAAQQRFDSQTAAYLQANDKAPQGLLLMAAWAKLAVKGEQLRLQKDALATNNAQLQQLVKESAAAADRLFVSADDLRQLETQEQAKEQELKTAHENLTWMDAYANNADLDQDENKAHALLFEQRVRQATIMEALVNAAVTREKIELQLVRLLIAKNSNEFQDGGEELRTNLDKIDRINARFELWREETEREQARAEKSLAALFVAASSQPNDVVHLTQQRLTAVQDSLLSLQRLDGEIHDARLIGDRMQTLVAGQEGVLKSGLVSIKILSAQAWAWVDDNLTASIFKIGETPVTSLGLLRLLLIVTLAWVLSHFVRRGLTHLSDWRRGGAGFVYALGRLTHYLILITGISIGLSSIGVDLSSFALIAGGLSLGVGFGLQAIVSNFVSGLIVLFERSLRIGDFVELSSGVAGEVRAINVRSTLVTTPDMVEILVPNSEFVNGKVINWTLTDASRRFHIAFGVAYGSDKELVRRAALEAAHNAPHTMKNYKGREPEVWLTNFGDSSLNFELVVWVLPQAVKKPQRVRADYYWELETALKKQGIELPFPQRDIHIRSGMPETAALSEKTGPPNQQGAGNP